MSDRLRRYNTGVTTLYHSAVTTYTSHIMYQGRLSLHIIYERILPQELIITTGVHVSMSPHVPAPSYLTHGSFGYDIYVSL
ncbi:hypothetical protein GDO81_011218 [Engystomops pustulosus]|uniref:Uncharacterized protein n=1 Tax=Engystomops pustulosus TaxID=76066 RepID=A0AAV7BCS3_ENGPU|nr:hypothetical protein GDO81_011218 [Engystomops pustulosus]